MSFCLCLSGSSVYRTSNVGGVDMFLSPVGGVGGREGEERGIHDRFDGREVFAMALLLQQQVVFVS